MKFIYSVKSLHYYAKRKNEKIYGYLCSDISRIFIGAMLSIKPKLYIQESIKYIRQYPDVTNLDELKKKSDFYNAPTFSPLVFKELNEKVFGKERFIKIATHKKDII